MATTADRKSWVIRRMSGTVDGIDLALLDPADPDERRLLIEAEHPRLLQALRDDVDELVLDGQVMSPRLHITLHEIVAERIWADVSGHGSRRSHDRPRRLRSAPKSPRC